MEAAEIDEDNECPADATPDPQSDQLELPKW